MSSANSYDPRNALFAFTMLHDRAALEIIKAVYRPSFITTLEHHKRMKRLEAEYIFDVALVYWWDNPSKPLLGDQQSLVGDILKYIVHLLDHGEINNPEGLHIMPESDLYLQLKTLFESVYSGRMYAASKCAQEHESSIFDITAFHRGAPEEDEILREAFWMVLMMHSDKFIEDTRYSIKIVNSVFDELDSKRRTLASMKEVKHQLFEAVYKQCKWCLSTEKRKW